MRGRLRKAEEEEERDTEGVVTDTVATTSRSSTIIKSFFVFFVSLCFLCDILTHTASEFQNTPAFDVFTDLFKNKLIYFIFEC